MTENYADTNPATGTVYMLRVNNLYTINEAQAGAGYNGTAKNPAGVITIPLGGPASSEGLVVNAASNKIYVADGSNFFYSINGATNVATLLPGMPANLDVSSLAIDSATNQILVFDYFSGNLFVLDGTSETVVKTIPIGQFPRGTPLLVDPVKGVAYVVGYSVYVVDLATAMVTATIPLSPTLPFRRAQPGEKPAVRRHYRLEGVVINTSTNKIVTSFSSPYNPTNRIAVNPVTGKYYVIGLDELGSAACRCLQRDHQQAHRGYFRSDLYGTPGRGLDHGKSSQQHHLRRKPTRHDQRGPGGDRRKHQCVVSHSVQLRRDERLRTRHGLGHERSGGWRH